MPEKIKNKIERGTFIYLPVGGTVIKPIKMVLTFQLNHYVQRTAANWKQNKGNLPCVELAPSPRKYMVKATQVFASLASDELGFSEKKNISVFFLR